MCTNADDGIILMESVEEHLTGASKTCRKCGGINDAAVVLRKKDSYCKACFLSSVNHKFRACLGKSKTMRPGDKVLVGFSGTANCVALLHLIRTGIQDTSHKRLMFKPYIVYVDESRALNLTKEEQNRIKDDISAVLQEYDYPYYSVPLELATYSEENIESYFVNGSCNGVDKQSLDRLFNTITSISSKTDLINKLRQNLIAQVARSLGCNKVFTAETANDLAVKLLTNVSLGRGAQLPYDVGFSDDRFAEVKLVRPLRDLSKKELVFYNIFHSLSSVHIPSWTTKTDAHSSIQKLTESFLCELQDGFPSTLSTVFRVADKLTTSSSDCHICPLCQAPVDVDGVSSSSLSATQFSRLVSSSGPSNFDGGNLVDNNADSTSCGGSSASDETVCGSGRGSCCNRDPTKAVLGEMCYGCNLILRDADITSLPLDFIRHLEESNQRLKMKKEIQDFLL